MVEECERSFVRILNFRCLSWQTSIALEGWQRILSYHVSNTETFTQKRNDMTSKTPRPRRKVLGAAFTGALVTLTVFVLNTYVISDPDKKVTSDASAAATTVLSSLIAYLIPPDPNEITTVDEDGNTKCALKE